MLLSSLLRLGYFLGGSAVMQIIPGIPVSVRAQVKAAITGQWSQCSPGLSTFSEVEFSRLRRMQAVLWLAPGWQLSFSEAWGGVIVQTEEPSEGGQGSGIVLALLSVSSARCDSGQNQFGRSAGSGPQAISRCKQQRKHREHSVHSVVMDRLQHGTNCLGGIFSSLQGPVNVSRPSRAHLGPCPKDPANRLAQGSPKLRPRTWCVEGGVGTTNPGILWPVAFVIFKS